MEKKNTILLTVIAIATLLVAVVGATFAYFTAQVKVDDTAGSATTTAKTYVLPSATMAMGANVSGDTTVYPGAQFVRSLSIDGTCTDANGCQTIQTTIEVKATGLATFGGDVTWYLFEKDSEIAADLATCTNTSSNTDGKYFTTNACKTQIDTYVAKAKAGTVGGVMSGTTDGTVTTDLPVSATTAAPFHKDYYLIVDYTNKESDQSTGQMGQEFTVTMNYYATKNS